MLLDRTNIPFTRYFNARWPLGHSIMYENCMAEMRFSLSLSNSRIGNGSTQTMESTFVFCAHTFYYIVVAERSSCGCHTNIITIFRYETNGTFWRINSIVYISLFTTPQWPAMMISNIMLVLLSFHRRLRSAKQKFVLLICLCQPYIYKYIFFSKYHSQMY